MDEFMGDPELDALERALDRAVCPEDLFGTLAGSDAKSKRAGLKLPYTRLVKMCHADVRRDLRGKDLERASVLMSRLTEWHALALERINDGSYNDRAPRKPPFDPVPITVGGVERTLTGRVAEGLFATIYDAGTIVGTAYTEEGREVRRERKLVAKVVREPGDAGLLETEAVCLLAFAERDPDRSREAFYQTQRAYVPWCEGQFALDGPGHTRYRGTLLSVPQGACFTIQELRDRYFPGGIPPEHVYWIFRRLLLTIWIGHLHGVVHGAVTPDHVLVYPDLCQGIPQENGHGLVLLDWTCSALIGRGKVPAMDPRWTAFIAPEIRAGKPPDPSSDLFAAAATAIYAMGGDVPSRRLPSIPSEVASEIARCLDRDPKKRPQDANEFHDRFGELLINAGIERVYRPFSVG